MFLKILGRVGTHFFLNDFFSGKKKNFIHFDRFRKKIILCILKGIFMHFERLWENNFFLHFERQFAFQMHKIIFFSPENLKKF